MTETTTKTKNSVPNLDSTATKNKVYETIIDTVKDTTPDTFSNSGWRAVFEGWNDDVECTLQKSSYPLDGSILYDNKDYSFYFKLNSTWVGESLYETVSEEYDRELSTTERFINAVERGVRNADEDNGGSSKTIFGSLFRMSLTKRGNGKRKYHTIKKEDDHDFTYLNYRIIAWGVDGNSIERKYNNQISMMKAVNDVADFLSKQTILFKEEADRMMFKWLGKKSDMLKEKIEQHKTLLKTFADIENKWEALDNLGFSDLDDLEVVANSWFDKTYKFRKATPIGVFEIRNEVSYSLDENKVDEYDNIFSIHLATTEKLMQRAESGEELSNWDFNEINDHQTLEQVLEFMSHIV